MPWKKINASIDRRSAQRIWAVFNYSIISLSCEMEPHAYWFIKWNIVLFKNVGRETKFPPISLCWTYRTKLLSFSSFLGMRTGNGRLDFISTESSLPCESQTIPDGNSSAGKRNCWSSAFCSEALSVSEREEQFLVAEPQSPLITVTWISVEFGNKGWQSIWIRAIRSLWPSISFPHFRSTRHIPPNNETAWCSHLANVRLTTSGPHVKWWT